MGHLTYPSATHTRFAHSLGVFKIMCRITEYLEKENSKLFHEELRNDLRLAALLHDIGHYPYSHLMEKVERVTLTEDELIPKKASKETGVIEAFEKYPNHEQLGEHIILNQEDILVAIGGEERAMRVASIFQRTEAADQQVSKLIHSSLDMDRLDYLLRDSRSAGVPYGEIDLNYLLNNIRISKKGEVGVTWKALTAAEHFLLARMSMYRAVYYHKTTFGFEEACRQLLRRARNGQKYDIAKDGNKIREICATSELLNFTDEYVDRIIRDAANDDDPSIQPLAKCITARKPPKLIREVSGMFEKGKSDEVKLFVQNCRFRLLDLAKKYKVNIGQFLLCAPPEIQFEERGGTFKIDEFKNFREEREELIKVFPKGSDEPKSLVDIPDTLISYCSDFVFKIQRLYLADPSPNCEKRVRQIRNEVQGWGFNK